MSSTDELIPDGVALPSRRELLRRLGTCALLGAAVAAGGSRARAAAPPASHTATPSTTPSAASQASLLSEEDPAAKAVRYVADAARAKGANPGSTCANCALYQGKYGSREGPCQILPGVQVAAAGWCASWAPQM